MTGRSASELADLRRRLGRDLLLGWAGPAGDFTDADLATRGGDGASGVTDHAVAEGVPQAVQVLVNRLMTRRGELAALGHPDYGSRHHELVGEPDTPRTRNLVKLYVLEALRAEPRVQQVLSVSVRGDRAGRGTVRVELSVRLIDRPEPLNLVVGVDLGGSS